MIDAAVAAAIRDAVRAERGRVVSALRQMGQHQVRNGNDETGWAFVDAASLIEEAGQDADDPVSLAEAFRAKAHARLALR